MREADAAIRAEAFDWNNRVELGNGVAVNLVSTRHWTARGVLDRNKALWASFVLETPAGKIYIVCDPVTAAAVIFAMCASVTASSSPASCPSAPMSRAGSCAIST